VRLHGSRPPIRSICTVVARAERHPVRMLSVSRAWPWGLAVITDPGSSEPVPSDLDGNGIAAGRTVVAASIQHEVDGEAVAEVWLGRPPGDWHCVHEGEFVTVCGAVIVGDAAYEQHVPVEVGEGAHQLRVLVHEIGSPPRVAFSSRDLPSMADTPTCVPCGHPIRPHPQLPL
jgi:hypothetical protein